MQTNVGTMDRALRTVGGLALVGLAASRTVGPWAWVGVVPLVTGVAGWCPAYKALGLSTSGEQKTGQKN